MFVKEDKEKNFTIKYKHLKAFLRTYQPDIDKDSIFALVTLMKIYVGRKELGFHELNYKILIDLMEGVSKEVLAESIANRISVTNGEIDSVMNKIYTPSLDLDFAELLLIFKVGKNKSTKELYKNTTFYLTLKGVSFSKKQKNKIRKMIDTGVFIDILSKNHTAFEFDVEGERVFKDIRNEPTVTNDWNKTEYKNLLDDDNDIESKFEMQQTGEKLKRLNLYVEGNSPKRNEEKLVEKLNNELKEKPKKRKSSPSLSSSSVVEEYD